MMKLYHWTDWKSEVDIAQVKNSSRPLVITSEI